MLRGPDVSVMLGVASVTVAKVTEPLGGLGVFFSLPWQVWFIFLALWFFGSFVRLVVELQAETIRPGLRKGGLDVAVIFSVGGISAFVAFGFCEGLSSALKSAFDLELPVFITAISIATAAFNKRTILDKFSAKFGRTIDDSEIFKGRP